MKKLAVAIDFSDVMPTVLDAAVNMARALDASLYLVHVVEAVPSYGMYGFAPEEVPSVGPEMAEITLAAKNRVDNVARSVAKEGVTVHSVNLEGNILDEILDYVAEESMDMLILGSHGHGFIAGLLLGSVAEGAVRRATIPTLIIPSKKK